MIRIGWASRDVSTNEPVGIMGQAHMRISTGSFDPTTITVLALEANGEQIIFLSGDFTGFTPDLLVELKGEVAEKLPAIDPSKLILNATHTHTAPRYHLTSGYDNAPTDRVNIYPAIKYRRFLLDQMVSAIKEAWESRAPGSFAYGLGSAEVSVQRRSVYFNDKGGSNTAQNTFAVNGHGIMYGKTYFDDFSGYEGCVDPNAYFLFTYNAQGDLTGAVINVPCPSQCTEHEVFTSADYWHETREMIRAKYGNIFILPQCAAAGDLSPHVLHGQEALSRRDRLTFGDDPKAKLFDRPHEYYNRKILAERIFHAFEVCLAWAGKERFSEAEVAHVTKIVPLKAWKTTEEDYRKAKENYELVKDIPFQVTDDPLADFKANTTLSSNQNRYLNVIARYESNKEYLDTEIHVVKLGPIAFATCPFELYLDYQHRIQGRSPFTQTFIVQLSPSSVGTSGYLATEKAVANKGYSAIPFSCQVCPEGGQTLVEEILSELNRMK